MGIGSANEEAVGYHVFWYYSLNDVVQKSSTQKVGTIQPFKVSDWWQKRPTADRIIGKGRGLISKDHRYIGCKCLG